jgi:hypothetical protein
VSYAVAVGPSGRSIVVRHTSDFDTTTARAAAAAVQAFRETFPSLRGAGIVYDVRGVRNVSGLGRNYLFAWNDLPAVGFARHVRVAVVADLGDHTADSRRARPAGIPWPGPASSPRASRRRDFRR